MFCVACMMCDYDVAVQFATALLIIARNVTMPNNIRTCVFLTRFVFVNMDYMICVACMIFANVLAVCFAIALLSTSRNEEMQNKHNGISILTDLICQILIVYVLYSVYVICL